MYKEHKTNEHEQKWLKKVLENVAQRRENVTESIPRIVKKKGANKSQEYGADLKEIKRIQKRYHSDTGHSILKERNFWRNLDISLPLLINKCFNGYIHREDLILIEIARIDPECQETAHVLEMLDYRNKNGDIWTVENGDYFFENSDLNDQNSLLYKVLTEVEESFEKSNMSKDSSSLLLVNKNVSKNIYTGQANPNFEKKSNRNANNEQKPDATTDDSKNEPFDSNLNQNTGCNQPERVYNEKNIETATQNTKKTASSRKSNSSAILCQGLPVGLGIDI